MKEINNKKNEYFKPILIIICILVGLYIIGSLSKSESERVNTNIAEKVDSINAGVDSLTQKNNDSLLTLKLETVNSEIKKIKPLFRDKHDEFNKITWIEHNTVPRFINSRGFYTYIGLDENEDPTLRLVIRYYGDDWLFISKILVKPDDALFEIYPEKMERDNDSDVWEWMDIVPNDTNIAMLVSIISSKNTKVRFEGKQYYKDWTLTQKEIKGLNDTQKYYSLLREKKIIEKQLQQ